MCDIVAMGCHVLSLFPLGAHTSKVSRTVLASTRRMAQIRQLCSITRNWAIIGLVAVIITIHSSTLLVHQSESGKRIPVERRDSGLSPGVQQTPVLINGWTEKYGAIYDNTSDCYNNNPSGWHPRRIELVDLVPVESIQRGRLEIVRHLDFGTAPVLAKMVAFPGDMLSLAQEDTMYRLLYALGITPHFLGHITIAGRIIGFLTEYIQERGPSSSSWDQQESGNGMTEACLTTLRRLHARGIAHGDAHGGNCLVRQDGSAVLIDFELALETFVRAEFDRDLWIMSHTKGG